MKFAICNEIFKGWKIEEAMGYAAKAGYDAIEIAPFTMAKYVTEVSAGERQKIREAASRHGIAVSGIHWVLVEAEGMHLTHPESAVRERTSRYFPTC
jgi:sugar phosphate isomerase/epimerase